MNEEMDSLYKNKTWLLVDKPAGQKVVSCKWLYKVKDSLTEGGGPRYKARLVAKDFTQIEDIDYNKIFSPVVNPTSIRVMLSLVAHFDLELEQLDVKTTFLHGDLDEHLHAAT